MAVDEIRLSPDSFRTIYLRKEDRVILRTERGKRIIIKRIIPEEWQPLRVYDYETTENENKRNIKLIDRNYLEKVERDLIDKLR